MDLENVNQKLQLEKKKNVMSQAQLDLEENAKELGKELIILSNKNKSLERT